MDYFNWAYIDVSRVSYIIDLMLPFVTKTHVISTVPVALRADRVSKNKGLKSINTQLSSFFIIQPWDSRTKYRVTFSPALDAVPKQTVMKLMIYFFRPNIDLPFEFFQWRVSAKHLI